ncbi:tRNA (adenosine(37)-N6)-threonylcarbamoyltransferase complex dimerization subunit type 1 TsaB [Sulfitobacter sp. CW3]|uniref:tRNA (adenosine(37)-N6)-threonylcarbamoyltransferase complex dimerization subunit type 1 TsaB n=1 Tax=Sulfitobacter sp. CW3 TaxID=2861965 RepID=UPI001C5F852D|nr:tRNA (adenosine(37)-N6)-threonylcarbamoyltransferase complex dimerization subunit type 1 TsaB [Sulfitobacter sp. CW3]MBW4961256.1 tRNA (adenosine(37)-N6)-threonylcarbamoyltransferase complex dimerization subunit type 1 TsaB [Sulfitobacter sp. CW3]
MPKKPLILAFDTSAAHCAAALLSGDHIVASILEPMAKGQGERLLGLCGDVLEQAGVTYQDLTAIGVGIGPGNFTGIRISVSAARGLALGLGIPAIGVSQLEALAHGTDGVVIASVDARQDKMYVQVTGTLDDHPPSLCSLDDLPTIPSRADPTCIGFQADMIAALCNGTVRDPQMPLADAIAHIAASRASRDNPRPAPLYLRPADAAPARDAPPAILP